MCKVGVLGAGGVTNANAAGWRDIFWMQVAFHLARSLGLFFYYYPMRRSDYPKMSLTGYMWACNPIGSIFIYATTLLLLTNGLERRRIYLVESTRCRTVRHWFQVSDNILPLWYICP